jgi:predicted kinase
VSEEIAAVLIGGPPATGKSTLAMALAPRLDAAVLDLDVATAPLTRVVSELTGLHDLDDPALAGLTRDARYDTLLGLAAANLAAGRPVVLVAPFTLERSRVSAWAATTRRIPAPATMVWLYLEPGELIRRLTARGLARDEGKLRDPASYLTGLDLEPPAIPHLAVDASQPTAAQVTSVLNHLSGQGALGRDRAIDGTLLTGSCHRWHSRADSRYAIDGTEAQRLGLPSMARMETAMTRPPGETRSRSSHDFRVAR